MSGKTCCFLSAKLKEEKKKVPQKLSLKLHLHMFTLHSDVGETERATSLSALKELSGACFNKILQQTMQ